MLRDERWACELHKRGTLIPSEAANWCEWINHPLLAVQNTSVWANGRTPPAWGEKLMRWWAMSQIFTGQIRACRLFHYLPVSRPVICSVFLSISVHLRPSLSLSPLSLSLPLLLSRILARSVKSWLQEKRDEKKTKCLLIQRLCVTALSESITLITPTGEKKKKKREISRRVSKPNIQNF